MSALLSNPEYLRIREKLKTEYTETALKRIEIAGAPEAARNLFEETLKEMQQRLEEFDVTHYRGRQQFEELAIALYRSIRSKLRTNGGE
jgi:uncharacterized protein YjaG (DUF416 family)